MTRFLFVSLPLAGHLDWGGMLATAAALAQNPNHQVAWASGPQVATAVGRAGVEFVNLPSHGLERPIAAAARTSGGPACRAAPRAALELVAEPGGDPAGCR